MTRGKYRLGTYAILMPCDLDCRMDDMSGNRNAPDSYQATVLNAPLYPGCGVLRRAVRGNIVSFPALVPPLLKTPSNDVQWRVVLLYFVRGWSSVEIGARFNLPKHRIRQILRDWSVRAFALGCMEVIDPEAFRACCLTNAQRGASVAPGLFLAALQRGVGAVERFPVVSGEEGVSYAVA